MEKYLKAQDVCKAFADYIWSPLPRTISYASSFVEKIPAADVVEVLRCGQCKYWKQRDNREYGLCVKHKGIWLNSDFCSKGERKDGEQDNV